MSRGAPDYGTRAGALFDRYAPPPLAYDELSGPTRAPRPHWVPLVAALDERGPAVLATRWDHARRAIRENGVTYNVYGDPEGMDRPWQLDMLPLPVPADEWRHLEAGLVQRARLLNLILDDAYGPQSLLASRLLPPELVLGSPAFLRPCYGVPVPQGIRLHLHAADLARDRNGTWHVLADRTQAPSGAGYALENRIVLSRALPEAFRDCRVQRLAGFFRAHHDGLQSLAAHRAAQPRIVLLTPGPHNETYFEHAYLARYLGFTLVEGADLRVRDSRLFLKTLDGLEPVDVVYRRQDDGFCDPLALRGASSLGVPALVEAVRAGNVAVANALGSGVVETAALMPFLPALCHHLLGEQLLLPSAPTWWCGDESSRHYVLDHLDDLVIKRAFPGPNREPVFVQDLTPAGRAELKASIAARPEVFVAQEHVTLSTAPVWLDERVEARRVVLRAYTTASPSGFAVMPGGLSRVSSAADVPIVSMQRGGRSKDTWVLSDGPISQVTLLAPAGMAIRRERSATALPSRVADNLFWLGRHAERAEHALRVLRSVVIRLADEDTNETTPEFVSLLRMAIGLGLIPPSLTASLPFGRLESELFALLFDNHSGAGLSDRATALHRVAVLVRDRLSADTWRIVNQLQQDACIPSARRVGFDEALTVLNRLVIDLAALSGLEMENMTRGLGWRFLEIGRRIERAINLCGLIRAGMAADGTSGSILRPLLEIADSTMTYRLRYFAEPVWAPVLDLLLADETNTRALAFQLAALCEHVRHLPRGAEVPSPSREERLVERLSQRIATADLAAACTGEDGAPGAEVPVLLRDLEQDLRALSDVLTHYYFSHTVPRIS